MKFKSIISFKVLLFLVISSFYLYKAVREIDPYPTGDAPEYILMTESYKNHFSSNITSEDFLTFKQDYIKVNDWNHHQKADYFAGLENHLKFPNKKFMDNGYGIYTARNLKEYSYHFPFYSFVNLPLRLICSKFELDPLRGFIITNALLILLTSFILLFFSPFNEYVSISIALCFAFSSNYWYLSWIHCECMAVCFTTLGFWFFFQKRYYFGLVLIALTCLQYQPLIILLGFLSLIVLIRNGLKIKNLILLSITTIIGFAPPIFYFYHFGTTNLIKDSGFLSTDYITFTRILGFYFDVNQGVILAIPMILIAYFLIWAFRLYRSILIEKNFQLELLLPLVMLAITFVLCTMINWNHGQAIINRYASWFSALIMIHTFFMLKDSNLEIQNIIYSYFVSTQLFTAFYHNQFNDYDWSCVNHRPLAKWLMRYHPNWYNPDPHIFLSRTTGNFSLEASNFPALYFSEDGVLCKAAIHRDKIPVLQKMNIIRTTDLSQIKHLKFINDWAYFNKGIDYGSFLNFNDLKSLNQEIEINKQIELIKSSKDLLNDVRLFTEEKKVSFEVATREIAILQIIKMDAIGMNNIKVQIKSNSNWMKQIEQKSIDWNLPIDSVITLDAIYQIRIAKGFQ